MPCVQFYLLFSGAFSVKAFENEKQNHLSASSLYFCEYQT